MKATDRILIVGLLLFCFFLISLLYGMRFNFSHSFPPGIYWQNNILPQKGDLVSFCPPNTEVFLLAKARGFLPGGLCPGNYRPLIKKIVAIADDHISINENGVFVNGILQKNSRPLKVDLQGLAMPVVYFENYTIPFGKILLLSDYHPFSFDGRYIGLSDVASIQGKIIPLITW